MLRAGARLPHAAPAIEAIGMKLNDVGTPARLVLCNLEAVSAQDNHFPLAGPAVACASSGTFRFFRTRKNLYGEINHQQETGDHPTELQPEQRVGKMFPHARMQTAPPHGIEVKRAEVIRHSPPLTSPRTTRRDTMKLWNSSSALPSRRRHLDAASVLSIRRLFARNEA